MKKLLCILTLFAFMCACTNSEDGVGSEPQEPQPQKPQSSITIVSNTASSFEENGGNGQISFTTNEEWTAEIINSRADNWISIQPTSGNAGDATITVTTKPNTTTDERSASILLKAGTAQKTVKVSQKQKDALTVTASTFEIGNEGGEIEIEVKANIDFEYKIEDSAKEWVTYKSTRAMKTSTLTFAIEKNNSIKRREANIYITSDEFKETITIYQAGEEPTIVISKNDYVVPSAGETIVVDVASNVDVSVELPTDVDWVTENATRSLSTNTFYFDIAPNEEYDHRKAEIKFINTENNLSEIVNISQSQKDAIVIAENSYTIGSEGDEIEIEINHNVEFDIQIEGDWITQNQTRALETSTLTFIVAENTTDVERSGSITFTSKDDSLSQTISITQNAMMVNYKIYYVATSPIVPDADAFDANIVSTSYDTATGKGVITFDNEITEIGYAAFRDCSSLTSITIPDSVTSIGEGAFRNCSSLTSVTIPDSVTSIGEYAFYNCSSLTSVTIGDSVTSIGEDTFCYCISLTNITIPDSVTSIGEDAFFNCSKLTSITIPDNVASIGNGAFEYCRSLTSVTIPDRVTSIGEYTFCDCSSLTNITIPDSIKSIGYNAFRGCSSLTSINIPDGVTSIGENAFYGCKSLTSVTIPNSVTKIEEGAFSYCSSLTGFYGKYTSSDNRCLVINNELITFAPAGITSYTIPNNVTKIGDYAFTNNYNLTSVVISNSVTEIGYRAFGGCSSLVSVIIPESVTEIAYWAFADCISLTSFYGKFTSADNRCLIIDGELTSFAPAGITSYTIPNNVNKIGYSAFENYSNLRSITIPNSVTEIKEEAFKGCSNITSVTIPNSVTKIGNSAFYDCKEIHLKSATPPSLGKSVFFNSDTIYVPKNSLDAYYIWKVLYSYNIVADNGGNNNDDIIENNKIYYTGRMEPTIIASFGANFVSMEYNPETEEGVIIFDAEVTKIGMGSFTDCSGLKTITLPKSVTNIGTGAFANCTSLQSIIIPENVTLIEDAAFHNCKSLANVTIPEGVTTIGGSAFWECSSLIAITIPKSVTSMGSMVFHGCKKLVKVYCKPTTPPTSGLHSFEENASGRKIYVPKNSVNKYKSAKVWSNYNNDIQGYNF